MKRIIILLCTLLISLNVVADGHITVIKELIDKGDYETAKKQIELYEKLYPNVFTKEVAAYWTQKCNEGIKSAAEVKRKAQAEQVQRERKEARKQNKLVYISAKATTVGGKEYPGMDKSVKSDNLKYSDTEEFAYWSVYITAQVCDSHTETIFNTMTRYHLKVVAYLKIVDNITNISIYEEEIEVEKTHTGNYEGAADAAYRKIKNEIRTKIQTHCK